MTSKQVTSLSVRPQERQRGVATLVTAVVLMLAVFGITYYMSGAIITESRVVASHKRGLEAFNAAQAGIEWLKSNPNGAVSYSNPSPFKFDVLKSEPAPGLLKFESTGYSADEAVRRVISYSVGKKPSESNPPTVPIVAKGGVKTTGNISAVNNYSNLTVWNGLDTGIQGSASTYTKIDSIKNQLSTIKNTSGTATYGADVVTGDQNLANLSGDEIVDAFFGYPSLTDFANAMGVEPSDGRINMLTADNSASYCYKVTCGDSDQKVYSLAASGDINLSSKGFLSSGSDWNYEDWSAWLASSDIDGRTIATLDDGFSGSHYGYSTVSGSGETQVISPDSDFIGTPSNPVMIVVDGEVSIPSNTYVFGVVVAKKIKMASNTQIFGGVVALSNDDDAFQGAGGGVVYMDKMFIENAGQKIEYVPVKSGWKDW